MPIFVLLVAINVRQIGFFGSLLSANILASTAYSGSSVFQFEASKKNWGWTWKQCFQNIVRLILFKLPINIFNVLAWTTILLFQWNNSTEWPTAINLLQIILASSSHCTSINWIPNLSERSGWTGQLKGSHHTKRYEVREPLNEKATNCQLMPVVVIMRRAGLSWTADIEVLDDHRTHEAVAKVGLNETVSFKAAPAKHTVRN